MSEFGAVIKQLRNEKGWSQGQLAVYSETSQPTVNQIETGKRNPSTETLAKLARALEVEVAELFAKAPSRSSLEIADPDDFRRVVEEMPTAELKQTALELAGLTKVPTREDLDDNKEAHLRVVANHRIGVINVELDRRGEPSPVELVARRFNDATTLPEGPQEAQEEAG